MSLNGTDGTLTILVEETKSYPPNESYPLPNWQYVKYRFYDTQTVKSELFSLNYNLTERSSEKKSV